MFGILLSNREEEKKAEYHLNKMGVFHNGVSHEHSVLFRFKSWKWAYRGLVALLYSNVEAKLIYHIL